jgi:hypothetical protein
MDLFESSRHPFGLGTLESNQRQAFGRKEGSDLRRPDVVESLAGGSLGKAGRKVFNARTDRGPVLDDRGIQEFLQFAGFPGDVLVPQSAGDASPPMRESPCLVHVEIFLHTGKQHGTLVHPLRQKVVPQFREQILIVAAWKGTLTATQHEKFTNQGREGPGVNRLGDISVTARVLCLVDISFHGICRHGDDGRLAYCRIAPEPARQFQPIDAW